MRERIFKIPRLVVLLTALALCAFFETVRRDPYAIEFYLPYKTMMDIKAIIFMPFHSVYISFAELILYAAVMFVVFSLAYFVVCFIRTRKKGRFTLNFIVIMLALVLCVRVFFLVFCGVDYNRESVAQKMALDVRPQSVQVLYDTTVYVQGMLNEAAGKVERDEDGLFSPSRTIDEMLISAQDVFDRYVLGTSVVSGAFSPPKAVQSSEIMNRLMISGFYFPYTGEANVNVAEGYLYLPYTACHEKAHQCGVMREDEASFVSYLACMKSNDADFRYSALVKAYISLSNELYYTDRELYFEMSKSLDIRVIYDLEKYREHINEYAGGIAVLSENVNDTYLKAQGQSDGVESYGGLADLIIAYYIK